MPELRPFQELLEDYVRHVSGQRCSIPAFRRASEGWETEILLFSIEPPAPEFGGLRHLAARVYPWPWQADRVKAEFLLLRGLFETGYPVPRVVRFEPDASLLGGPFFVMEQVRGSLLGYKYTKGTEQEKRDVSVVFGDLLARLHRIDPAPFLGEGAAWRDRRSALTSLEPEILRSFLEPSSIARELEPIFVWMEEHRPVLEGGETCLLHGDFHLWNIMLAEDEKGTLGGLPRPVVVDWGQAGLGDPRHDIAQSMLLSKTQNMPGVAESCLTAYQYASGRHLEHLEVFEILALARRLGATLVCLADGPETLGLRPELVPFLLKRLNHLDGLCNLLEQQSSIRLPGVRGLLARWASTETVR